MGWCAARTRRTRPRASRAAPPQNRPCAPLLTPGARSLDADRADRWPTASAMLPFTSGMMGRLGVGAALTAHSVRLPPPAALPSHRTLSSLRRRDDGRPRTASPSRLARPQSSAAHAGSCPPVSHHCHCQPRPGLTRTARTQTSLGWRARCRAPVHTRAARALRAPLASGVSYTPLPPKKAIAHQE